MIVHTRMELERRSPERVYTYIYIYAILKGKWDMLFWQLSATYYIEQLHQWHDLNEANSI